MTEFAGIYRAALAIALDNGGINRDRPVEQQKREFHRWIKRRPQEPLSDIDTWLARLTDDEILLVCTDSEADESQYLLRQAPPFTDGLLTDYFDGVC